MTCPSLPPTPTQLLDLPGVQETTLEAVLYTPPNDEIFDENPCLSCGVCCSHFRVSFYSGELSGETGGTVPVELTTKVGPLRACMKGTEQGEGRCIALRGTLGQPGIHCAIYPDRPTPVVTTKSGNWMAAQMWIASVCVANTVCLYCLTAHCLLHPPCPSMMRRPDTRS